MTIYRCVASGVFAAGETWSFRQHFDSPAAISTISGDWFANLTTFWTNGVFGLQTIYPTGTQMTGSSVAALGGVPFREGLKQVTPMTDAGTNLADSLPEQTCILVSLRGAAVGKRNRGRIHLPAPAESEAVGGELGAAQGTRVTTAISSLYNTMRLQGHIPVVYNVKVSVSDPVVQTTKVIVTQETDRVLRTLRTRTKGRRAVYT